MKRMIVLCLLVLPLILTAQTPSKPANPFPNNKPKTPTPTPTTKPSTPTPVPAPGPATPVPAPAPTVPNKVPSSPVPNYPGSGMPKPAPIQGTDQEQIITTIYRVFDAMRLGDSSLARPLFAPNCRLYTPMTNASGQVTLTEEPLISFLKSIGTPRKQVVDERIIKYKMDIDGPLAQVWADYNLYIDGKFLHCGIDVFQLYKSATGWVIFELADTRRKTGCLTEPKVEVAATLDKWHADAAVADADAYFGAMTPDGVFLGTDATERWAREEFRAWAKPQFDAKKGWSFKASKRNITMANENSLAWFDEELTTWMGPCRGSGVLVKTPEGWKIKQYNLTMLVPNDKIQDYLKVIGMK